jgi:hypothetical protein
MSLTPEQLARLPKYAQSEIMYLTRALEQALAKLQEGPEEANAFLNPYRNDYRKPLGQDVTIQFGDEDGVHFVVKHESDKARLDVIAYGDHVDRMYVAPRGGNCVHVGVGKVAY